MERKGINTVAVHGGEPHPRIDGAAVAPIFQTATFVSDCSPTSEYHSVRYTRCNNNPTQQSVANKIAALEGAGAALVLSSGMAAISTTLLTLLRAGDHVLMPRCPYGGTHTLITADLPDLGISCSSIDVQDPDSWEAQLQPSTKVIYVEVLSNPLVDVAPLHAVVAFARRHGLRSVVDATFATPLLVRPLSLGFDAVVHSCTKYLNGHSDVTAGAVVGAAALVEAVRHKANHLGGAIDPHAAFLLQRGLKTVGLRVERQCANAQALAEALEGSEQVSCVYYPGLPGHPGHELAQQLFDGGRCGGVLAFDVVGGTVAAQTLLRALKVGLVAPSLGGVETLVTLPSATTHVAMAPRERVAIGITDSLIRVAVGIEDTADLVGDFMAALQAVALPAAQAS